MAHHGRAPARLDALYAIVPQRAACGPLGLALTISLLAFAATAAALPPNLALSARATATSEFSGQYLAQYAVDGKIPEAGSQEDLSQAWCVRGETPRQAVKSYTPTPQP